MSQSSLLDLLARLVSFDTQNPPRALAMSDPLFDFLDSTVRPRGFDMQTIDHGAGRISWHATRGKPDVLFNVHLDTVPAAGGWSGEPHRLLIRDGRAIGLGVCDIKGAAACLLELATTSEAPLAILFTTDEEGSESCCVANFIDTFTGSPPRLTIVAEPTGGRAVLGHRGYLSVKGDFVGAASHTSAPKSRRRSAVHDMVQWSAAALQKVEQIERQLGGDADLCFNIGTISGGIKNNMVADRGELRWSARPPAGIDCEQLLRDLTNLPRSNDVQWQTTFLGPSFSWLGSDGIRKDSKKPPGKDKPATGQAHSTSSTGNQSCGDITALLAECSIEIGPDVDFWTEAALFCAAGWPAIVLGPGQIAQAHTADEWVNLEELDVTLEAYRQLAYSPVMG